MVSLRAVLAGSLLFATTAAGQPSSQSISTEADDRGPGLKSPTLARVIGIIPGAGHLYAGEVEPALIVPTAMLSILLAGALVDGVACLSEGALDAPCERSTAQTVSYIVAGTIWAVSIFDAGRAARRTNAKRVSLLIQPTHALAGLDHDPTGVRLGVRITTR